MIAGLTAGSIAAIVAALVSLPLRSPDDAFFNTGSVAIASLIAGLGAGALWRRTAQSKRRRTVFAGVWTAALGAAALLSWAGETQLDRFLPFALPLAAIVFTLTGALTVLLSGAPAFQKPWLPAAALAVALAVGLSLAGQGDAESGRLELPPRAGLAAPRKEHPKHPGGRSP